MKIIDSHVHFPADAADGVWRLMCDAAKQSGIGKMIVSHVFCGGSYPTAEQLRQGNAFCFDQVRKSNGKLAGLVYLNPQLDSWEQELQEGIKNHAAGVKLWVSLKDEKGAMAKTAALLKRCGELRKTVLIHVFNRTGGNSPGEINMAEFMELAQAAPETVMIAAHSGGNVRQSAGFFRTAPENVYFDICGTAPENGMLDFLLNEVDARRILYGSDAMGRSFRSQLLKIFSGSASPEEQERILWKNAAELYGLEEPEDLPCPPVQTKAPQEDFFLFCGRWPFAGFPDNTPEKLDFLLEKEGVKTGFAASLDAVFSFEQIEANRRFGTVCRSLRHIRPLAVCNPESVNGSKILESALNSGLFAGIWFSPYIHAYNPLSERFSACLKLCAQKKIPVFLNLGVSEYRFRPLFFSPREAAVEEQETLVAQLPENRYTIQGSRYFPCRPPEGVSLNFCLTRVMDSLNDSRELPELPANAAWVQGSEYPFRPLRS